MLTDGRHDLREKVDLTNVLQLHYRHLCLPTMEFIMTTQSTCTHIAEISELKTAKHYECEECVKTGDAWVHLRTCQTCGVTLCCDSSINKHARRHAQMTGHPVISSAEPGEQWLYCYPDDAFANY